MGKLRRVSLSVVLLKLGPPRDASIPRTVIFPFSFAFSPHVTANHRIRVSTTHKEVQDTIETVGSACEEPTIHNGCGSGSYS